MYHLGIYYSSQKAVPDDLYSACRDYVYCIYRNKEFLSEPLLKEYDSFMSDFPYNPDYNGFSGLDGKFEASEEIAYVQEYCQSHNEFQARILEWHKVREFYRMIGLNPVSVKPLLESVSSLRESTNFDSAPLVKINYRVMHNISQRCMKSTAEERALWAMYLAILSIIGSEDFVETTSAVIKLRMVGAKNTEELEQILQDPQMKRVYAKFTSKYMYNKLLNLLQDYNMVRELAFRRRTYVSVKANNIQELVDMINKKDSLNQKKKQRDEEKKKAREQLKALFSNTKAQREAPIHESMNQYLENQAYLQDPTSIS